MTICCYLALTHHITIAQDKYLINTSAKILNIFTTVLAYCKTVECLQCL